MDELASLSDTMNYNENTHSELEEDSQDPSESHNLHLLNPRGARIAQLTKNQTPRKKSKVWHYFMEYNLEFHPDKEDLYRCKICKMDVLNRAHGAEALSRHMRAHPLHYKDLDGTPSHKNEDGAAPEMNIEEEDIKLLPRDPKSRSQIWNHFQKFDPEYHPEMEDYARCTICGAAQKWIHGVTNMWKHLASHPDVKREIIATETDDNGDGVPDLPSMDVIENPKLVPNWRKTKYWTYFMKYDTEAHPTKEGVARCSICDADVSCQFGSKEMMTHLHRKHPAKYLEIKEGRVTSLAAGNLEGIGSPEPGSGKKRKRDRESGVGGVEHVTPLANKKIINEELQMNREKHWMEMWTKAKDELKSLRKDLKEEEDENIREEIMGDINSLLKRKEDYGKLLGFGSE